MTTITPTPGAQAITDAAAARSARQHIGITAIAAAVEALKGYEASDGMSNSCVHARQLSDALRTILARIGAGQNSIQVSDVREAFHV